MITLLDGPVGTQLAARGVPTPGPAWSARAIVAAPDILSEIHAEYAAAGATVHTACTFRTRPADVGDDWASLARRAVALARDAVPSEHRIAASIAPIADCYRPDLSPPHARLGHRALARVLADAGADLLLCETFPHPGEALTAVEEAAATGVPTWLALTPGPDGTLLSPDQMRATARAAIDRGACAILVNCVAASRTLPFVRALAGLGAPFGAYANAGFPEEKVGWDHLRGSSDGETSGPSRYLAFAETWREAGATVIGTCCGTGPDHVRLLARRFHAVTAP